MQVITSKDNEIVKSNFRSSLFKHFSKNNTNATISIIGLVKSIIGIIPSSFVNL